MTIREAIEILGPGHARWYIRQPSYVQDEIKWETPSIDEHDAYQTLLKDPIATEEELEYNEE